MRGVFFGPYILGVVSSLLASYSDWLPPPYAAVNPTGKGKAHALWPRTITPDSAAVLRAIGRRPLRRADPCSDPRTALRLYAAPRVFWRGLLSALRLAPRQLRQYPDRCPGRKPMETGRDAGALFRADHRTTTIAPEIRSLQMSRGPIFDVFLRSVFPRLSSDPSAAAPCSWKARFAKSIPMMLAFCTNVLSFFW
jgi:hypothetical protein